MKKFISILLCIVLVFASMSIAVSAASTVNVVLGTTTATAGETVKVPVKLLNNSGVMGFKLIFDYDASILTPVSVEYGAAISSGLQDNIEGDSVPGKMCVYWAGTENVTAGGIWFYINFEVNSDSKGRTPVQVSYDQADTFNEDFEDVVLNCGKGYVNITNSSYSSVASFSLKGNDISAGEDFAVTVTADALTAVSSIELKVNYNSQVFDFKKLEAKGVKATAVEGDGVLTITITGASEEYSGTDILTLHFASSENTVGGKYEFTAVSTINNEDVYCKACSFYVVGGSQSGSVIYADDFYALPGETVEIPVYISNNTGIMGFRLNFTYNADLITPVSVTRGDVTAQGAFNDSIGTTDQNTFSVVWNNESEVYLNGKLLTMTFKVNNNAPYGTADIGVSFSQGDTFNESYGDVKLICNDIEGAVTNMVPVLKADTTVKPTEGYVYSSVTACNNISQMLTPRSGKTLVGAPNSTGYFGTGTKVSAKNSSGAVVENYTIVITADVNGDSAADALDAALVSMVANGKADLEGAYHQACDFNANDFIDVEDYQSIVNYIVA